MKPLHILIYLACLTANLHAQIKPGISARVDTSRVVIKKVYNLYADYLNSNPDSIYLNPNWQSSESSFYLDKSKRMRVDRGANQMFRYYKAKEYLAYYQPKILQIDSIDIARYQIKTMFAAACAESGYQSYTPDAITKLYAVRDQNGNLKLENAISHDTRNWKRAKYKFIRYVIHPLCELKEAEGEHAVRFCEQISRMFDIEIVPFDYYILPNSDEMGKLYNFEYWLSYMTGQTNRAWREIFTTLGNANYLHELVHILFPLRSQNMATTPMIVDEGLATWLAGPSLDQSFESALKQVAEVLKTKNDLTFENVQTFKIRNEYNNDILYITGAVICKLVFEKHGKKGIWELYNTNDRTFKKELERLFGQPYDKVEKTIFSYILGQ